MERVSSDEGVLTYLQLSGTTPLHEAVQTKSLADITEMVRQQYSMFTNLQDERGDTPLHIAARRSDTAIAELLIRNGADVAASMENRNKETPLSIALEKGNEDLIQLIVSQILSTDHAETIAQLVEQALVMCDHEKLKRLLPHYKGAMIDEGLRVVVERGNSECATLLLEYGANPRQTFRDGKSSFCLALDNNCIPILTLFLEQGWSKALDDLYHRKTLFHHAVSKGDTGVVALFLRHDQGHNINRAAITGETPLLTAVRKNNLLMVALLVEHGVDVNLSDNGLWTPLHLASRLGLDEIVTFLLEHGAVPSILLGEHRGWTPVHHAARYGSEAILRILLSYQEGKDAIPRRTTDHQRSTALQMAIGRGNLEIVRIVAEALPVNTKDLPNGYGNTALHRASSLKNLRAVQLVLPFCRDDINLPNDERNTPLSLAVYFSSLPVVAFLLENGAADSVNIKNANGYPPLLLLVRDCLDWDVTEQDIMEIGRLLLENGADYSAVTPKGETFLQLLRDLSPGIVFRYFQNLVKKMQQHALE